MRHLLLLLPFALLPLSAQAHDPDEDAHGSLGKHEHGVAALNLALEDKTLDIELETPAMNILGFEHAASSDIDKATLAAARTQLERPLELFGIPPAADCALSSHALKSPLFGDAPAAPAHEAAEEAHPGHVHNDIDADYSLACARPDALSGLDLTAFFKRFPETHSLHVQLIGPKGQQGIELTPAQPRVSF
ncbi:DUF2796 domain-containing protein [Pseudomonas sp. RIT-PI-AD]|uniref:DUF2796 domain-containing protein n=1 Tax=Pseudomonas sp. RIT-PI-AD TaxID=3035294 RepID=UPI0021DA8651|nr:DUF2796 domain-containing protein [Pseudomonas sp. RIT-PI-AD]